MALRHSFQVVAHARGAWPQVATVEQRNDMGLILTVISILSVLITIKAG